MPRVIFEIDQDGQTDIELELGGKTKIDKSINCVLLGKLIGMINSGEMLGENLEALHGLEDINLMTAVLTSFEENAVMNQPVIHPTEVLKPKIMFEED